MTRAPPNGFSPRRTFLSAVFLACAAIYFGACYRCALADELPTWAVLGQWSMFTEKEVWHHDLYATAMFGTREAPVDLTALFPSQWDSGPRYVRGPFRNNPDRLKILAHSVCGRMDPSPNRVAIGEIRWPAHPGVSPLQRDDGERRPLIEVGCAARVRLPAGVAI